jgi:adenine-specific DNA-methyltransferase
VLHPISGIPCVVPESGWRFATSEEMQRQIRIGLVQFREDHSQPPFRKAHLLPTPDELEDVTEGVDSEDSDEKDSEEAGLLVMPSLIQKQAQVSVKLLRKIFNGKKVFPNPKDHEVLMRLIRYVTGPNDLILDSFAGSGSTGHAVLQLNKTDNSKRRFILIELVPDIARDITAERVRRVANGIADLPPLGGGFRYCELGEPVFDNDGKIRETVSFTDLARHVFFSETGEPLPQESVLNTPLLGAFHGVGVYLLYNGMLGDKSASGGNVLTRSVLAQLPPFAGQKVIYCAGCLLGKGRLQTEQITIRQIPYEIKVS